MIILAALGTVAFAVQYTGNPNVSNRIDVVSGLAALGLLYGLAWINHLGHVRTAGLLTGWILTELILVINVASDILYHGYTWADVAGWDFAGFCLLIVAISVGIRPTIISYAVFTLQLIAIVVFIPQQPSVYTTDVAARMGAAGLSQAQASGQLIADLLLRTLLLTASSVVIGIVNNRETSRILYEIEDQRQRALEHEAVAYAQQLQLQHKQDEQEWIQREISRFPTVLARDEPYTPADIPSQLQGDPVIVTVRDLLANMVRRTYPGQRAIAALQAWTLYLRQLMKQSRDTQRLPVVQELLQLAVIPGTHNSSEARDVLIELRNRLTQITNKQDTIAKNEGDQVSNDIIQATREFTAGNYRHRLRASLVPSQYATVVNAVNIMLDDLEKQLNRPNRQGSQL